jgi:hypothetical protein
MKNQVSPGIGQIIAETKTRCDQIENQIIGIIYTGIFLLAVTAVCVLLFFPARAHAWEPDNLSKGDVQLEIAWQIVHFIDWHQTKYIANHPNDYYEQGLAVVVLGKHPDPEAVDLYMGLGALAHAGVTYVLPQKGHFLWVENWEFNPRRAWQHVTLGSSGACVISNISIGIGFDF